MCPLQQALPAQVSSRLCMPKVPGGLACTCANCTVQCLGPLRPCMNTYANCPVLLQDSFSPAVSKTWVFDNILKNGLK